MGDLLTILYNAIFGCIFRRRKSPVLLLGVALGTWTAAAEVVATEGRLVFRENGQTLTIRGWGTDGLRVTASPDASNAFAGLDRILMPAPAADSKRGREGQEALK